jgi:hypothetical protein
MLNEAGEGPKDARTRVRMVAVNPPRAGGPVAGIAKRGADGPRRVSSFARRVGDGRVPNRAQQRTAVYRAESGVYQRTQVTYAP